MNRWVFMVETRNPKKEKRKQNTNISILNLVQKNFNPIENNIRTTDVTYISTNEKQNNVYFSVVINHKTKEMEGFEISKNNDQNLVINTYKKLNCQNIIVHSNHRSIYFLKIILDF